MRSGPFSMSLPPLGLAALAALSLTPPTTAQSLETFVMTVGGDSSCWTFSAPAPVTTNFGPYGVSIPTGGIGACGVAGDMRSASSPLGPLTDAMALSTSWSAGSEAFSGSTAVRAGYGDLAAEAHGVRTYGGGFLGTTVAGAEGFGLFVDGLTITSPSVPNGQAGSLRIWATVSGSLSTTAGGAVGLELAYRIASSPTYTLVRGYAESLAPGSITSQTGNGLSGFVTSPGAVGGSGKIDSLVLPFVYGTAFDIELAMLAYAVAGGSCVLDSDFQARLTGMDVFGPSGQPIATFAVSSTSGTPYGAGGLEAATAYCTPGTSASGCAALLSASGAASASAPSGFVLHAAGVEGSKDGLFFFGTGGRQANPWGNGTSFQCVVPPVKRGGLLTGSGNAGACNGIFDYDLNARWQAQPAQNPGPGAIVQAQLWYRDPLSTSNQTTSLSNALEFAVQP